MLFLMGRVSYIGMNSSRPISKSLDVHSTTFPCFDLPFDKENYYMSTTSYQPYSLQDQIIWYQHYIINAQGKWEILKESHHTFYKNGSPAYQPNKIMKQVWLIGHFNYDKTDLTYNNKRTQVKQARKQH